MNSFPELPEWFWYPVVFGYGAIVGSFLNVLIYRLPLGMSVNRPASHCPNCNHLLGFWDNIPLIAFLSLGARCRYCRTPISWRYFSIELATACLWICLYERISTRSDLSWVSFVAQALFASVLVAMVFIDLDHFIAPDELNVAGFVLGLGRDLVCIALVAYNSPYLLQQVLPDFTYFGWLPRAIPGALTYGGILFLVSFAGFVFYARGARESLGGVARRFFTFEDLPEEEMAEEVASETDGLPTGDIEEEGDPPRLSISPGLLAFFSACFLAPVVQYWALLAFVIPIAAFGLISRRENETFAEAAGRFFRANDEEPLREEEPLEEDFLREAESEDIASDGGEETVLHEVEETGELTAEARAIQMQAEADQFAREAETGKHGGMGLGDVKLALAIGAILGPALAVLSLMIATALGAVTGIVIARRHNRSLRYGVPFVPFMAAGAIITMLYGRAFLDWYAGFLAPAPLPPAQSQPLRRPLRGG